VKDYSYEAWRGSPEGQAELARLRAARASHPDSAPVALAKFLAGKGPWSSEWPDAKTKIDWMEHGD
jgi:hypothetical protein